MEEANIQEAVTMSKIPEPIKFLPSYDGNEKALHHWLATVEGCLAVYEPFANNVFYGMWFTTIRAKIVGKANEALITHNIPNNWALIRARLIEVFGDRRDLSTLCQGISLLRQGKKTLDIFYEEVNSLDTDISIKINQDPNYENHQNAVMHFVRMLTKNSFIDGLNEPYSSYTRNYRPDTLQDAYKAALAQQLAEARKKDRFPSSQDKSSSQNRFQRGENPNNQTRQQNSAHRSNFVPRENANRENATRDFQNAPRGQQNASRSVSYQQNPRQFQRQTVGVNPTPMEVDVSMRSRQSATPMSISGRLARNNQIANVEEEEEEELDDNANENDFEDSSTNENDELNFHLAGDTLLTG